ncbi:hypothetical protein P7F88_03345 [Vibrio hannami]|uniref:hypothetical protein n=1 Tax=Vibrio hannami TaxID=2717094 RepID=UPI00240FD0F4|nr:hypothetical protein [Vibrio hannami]MDG3085186.1 hypothetical protein [Vibrio hannami]
MKKLLAFTLAFFSVAGHAEIVEKVYKGLYVYGHEVHSFRACNTEEEYWVSYNWAGLEMNDFYKANQKENYQPMYIEFRGQILNEQVDGFASDFDGLIRVSEVKQYTFILPESCK